MGKKFKSFAAALLILVSSSGTTIAMHYCGKSLEGVAVFGKAKPCCEGIQMPAGCCHEEKVQIKSDNFSIVQQISNIGFVPVLLSEIALPVFDFSLHFQNAQTSFIGVHGNAHPPTGPDIIILVQSFLI